MRFPDFQEGWVTKEFAEVGVFFKGIGISKDKLTENGNPCILYGELYTKYKNEVIKEVFSKTNINPKGLVSSKANDIIIPSSGETAVDIATACCVNLNDVLLGGDLNVIRPYKDNGNFISYQLNGKRKFEIAKIAQGSSVTHLYNSSLQKLKINLPSDINEQDKIASLLSILDDRVATQSKIIEGLNVLKAAVTKRIFSGKLKFTDNRGNDFPKWEWKKLEDIGEFSGGGTPTSSNSSFWNGNIPWISSSDLSENDIRSINITRFITESAIINSATKLFAAPVILIVTRVGVGKVAYSEKKLCTSQDFLNMHKFSCNGLFLTYLLSIEMKKAASSTQGTSIKGISSMEIKLKNIFLPCMAEQNKIAEFLNTLDKKVDTESRVLQKLILQKQYLLQHLFI